MLEVHECSYSEVILKPQAFLTTTTVEWLSELLSAGHHQHSCSLDVLFSKIYVYVSTVAQKGQHKHWL